MVWFMVSKHILGLCQQPNTFGRISETFYRFIIWLVFVADITHALIGKVQLNGRALFSRNAHRPISDYAN